VRGFFFVVDSRGVTRPFVDFGDRQTEDFERGNTPKTRKIECVFLEILLV
jgi:hypothetical protein